MIRGENRMAHSRSLRIHQGNMNRESSRSQIQAAFIRGGSA